jgi:hypothetical protein
MWELEAVVNGTWCTIYSNFLTMTLLPSIESNLHFRNLLEDRFENLFKMRHARSLAATGDSGFTPRLLIQRITIEEGAQL